MRTNNLKKQIVHEQKLGSVVAGVVGAIAIAGVAVGATMLLEDEKTRNKIKKTLEKVKDQTISFVDSIKTEPNVIEGTTEIKKIGVQTNKVIKKNLI